jgi:REP element-mobilizing transposase RayT
LDGQVMLNGYGALVRDEWWRSAILRAELALDTLVIMPNHLHATLSILSAPSLDRVGAHGRAPLLSRPPKSLGSFVAGFKAATTKRINAARGTAGTRVWQRNFHERIIRDSDELEQVRRYIASNPDLWNEESENPENAEQTLQKAKAQP